ncbi:MAG: ribonuclease P protein component [Actinomycetota bacterium]
MIWRVRDRDSFAALAAARRHRRGALTMTGVAVAPAGPPRVAFAIGRGVGNAVVRNQVRRRLRAAVARQPGLRPGHAYLIGAAPAAAEYTMSKMTSTLRALAAAVHGEPA